MEIENLINILSSGVIVPVLGSDFCRVKISADRVDPRKRFRQSLTVLKNSQNETDIVLPINQYLAIRMADKSNFGTLADEELSLSSVFLKSEYTEDTKYKMLHDEYEQLSAEKQLDGYLKLAAINKFQFYINTGPDSFLLDAFAKLGNRKPQFIASQLLESNNNHTPVREPSEFEPIVFNIFGSIVKAPYNDCAITE